MSHEHGVGSAYDAGCSRGNFHFDTSFFSVSPFGNGKNAELLKEVLTLNDIVLKLTNENAALKAEVKAVRQENKEMSDEISRLREKLDGVKTITRVKKDENK